MEITVISQQLDLNLLINEQSDLISLDSDTNVLHIKYFIQKKFNIDVPFIKVSITRKKRKVQRIIDDTPIESGDLIEIRVVDEYKFNPVEVKSGFAVSSVTTIFSKIVYLNGDIYEGSVRNNKPEGFGYLKLTNGISYSGQFKEGIYSGHGVLKLPNGVLNGYFEDHVNVSGVFHYSNGVIFTGNWRNGFINGHGIFKYPVSVNGEIKYDVFDCEIVDDIFEGPGTFYYHNGDKFIGNYKNNLRSGKGKFFLVKDICLKRNGMIKERNSVK